MNQTPAQHQVDCARILRWIHSGVDVLMIDLCEEPLDDITDIPTITMRLHELPGRMADLPRNGLIVFASSSARRSAAAACYLRQEGFDAWSLAETPTPPITPNQLKLASAEDR